MSQEPTFERYVRDLAAAMQQQGSRAGTISPETAVSGTRETGVSSTSVGGDMLQQDPRFIGGLLAGLGSVISSPAGQQVIAQLPGLLSGIFGGRRELEEISSSDIVQQDPRFIGGLLSSLPPLINSPIGQQVIAQLPTILGGLFRRRRDLEVAQQDPRFLTGVLSCLPSLNKLPGGQQIIGQAILGGCFGGRRREETTQGGRNTG